MRASARAEYRTQRAGGLAHDALRDPSSRPQALVPTVVRAPRDADSLRAGQRIGSDDPSPMVARTTAAGEVLPSPQPMEPKKQIEIQLGHMCNNRCVFCVSGQQTARGRALPLAPTPILDEITRAHADGHRKLTLLGGEPTLQPDFLRIVRHAVALGFDEIVVFTNGVKTARGSFVDEILATGGNFTFRISLQGATKESHERTTKKDGSFDRILRTFEHLRARGQRITVNMCVVRSNYESVDRFPELLLPFGIRQLHLDMVRPLDAGERTEDELRAMLPRYVDMVPALERMIAGFPEGFDVNIGNLPYCVAPTLAPFIHHDGEKTMTIAVDGENELSRPWDKYLVKRRDKLKPPSCATCVFDGRCSGVFETYRDFYGTDELVPIDASRLRAIDPERRLLALHLRSVVDELASPVLAPFDRVEAREAGDREVHVTFDGPERVVVALHEPRRGLASFDELGVSLVGRPGDPALALATVRAVVARLASRGHRLLFPVAEDLVAGATAPLASRLARLRSAAPFGALAWTGLSMSDGGRRAELSLEGSSGERATVWLADRAGAATGGYDVHGAASAAVVEGLRRVMGALGGRAPTS